MYDFTEFINIENIKRQQTLAALVNPSLKNTTNLKRCTSGVPVVLPDYRCGNVIVCRLHRNLPIPMMITIRPLRNPACKSHLICSTYYCNSICECAN